MLRILSEQCLHQLVILCWDLIQFMWGKLSKFWQFETNLGTEYCIWNKSLLRDSSDMKVWLIFWVHGWEIATHSSVTCHIPVHSPCRTQFKEQCHYKWHVVFITWFILPKYHNQLSGTWWIKNYKKHWKYTYIYGTEKEIQVFRNLIWHY